MLIVIAALIAATAFVVLMRLLWVSERPGRYTTIITLAAAALVLGLAVLAATGRLHWLAAAAAAAAPFLRRGLKLVKYLPWIGSLLSSAQRRAGSGPGPGNRTGSGAGDRQARSNGALSRQEALDILGLGTQPSREEIVSARRRLIQKLYPDRGGSKYLAQQLNEAKQRLLEDL